MTKIDHTDIEILRVLQRNGKLTVKELAEPRAPLALAHFRTDSADSSAKATSSAMWRRLTPRRWATDCGVLQHQTQTTQRPLSEEFMEAVRGIDEITECYNTSGDFDFMIKIFVRDMEHYQDFVLHKLGRIDSIGSLHSVLSSAR